MQPIHKKLTIARQDSKTFLITFRFEITFNCPLNHIAEFTSTKAFQWNTEILHKIAQP